ncbi:MAG: flagellar hook protein FlgE [Clostridia bacterium]|jgi:flagellar hook protein FlgE|nr:flagellar hook protein FlgE [Clostridia bacterium]
MMRSLYSAVSGLKTHQVKMDVVGNNIANVNTIGFKKSNVTFQDTLSQTIKAANAPSANTGGTNPAQIGTGVMIGSINTVHTQGAISTTGNNTDVMIQGDGFFMLGRGNEIFYTRAGAFSFDSEGYLVNSSNGMYVLDTGGSEIQISDIETVKSYDITANGDLVYVDANGNNQVAGTIGLAKFANPSGLKKVGENMYIVSNNSGAPEQGQPGQDGRGTLISGSLEMSNVDLAQEFTDMIITQRGFQANSRTIRVSDEMLQELVNLKR